MAFTDTLVDASGVSNMTRKGGRMGNYNSQYASYYNSLVNKRGSYNNSKKLIPTFDKKYFITRITRDLIGTFILFVFVITCKIFVSPATTMAYKYSKSVVNNNLDVKAVITKVKSFKVAEVQTFYEKNLKGITSAELEDKTTDWIDSIISKVTGKKSWKAMVKEDYAMPADGKIMLPYGGTNEGIDIDLAEGTEIKACYNGIIKECGTDDQIGQYIIISHDNNVETKYGNLKELNVKKGDQVKKSQVIAKSGAAGKLSGPHLYFELTQMGESKNPQDYFNFKAK